MSIKVQNLSKNEISEYYNKVIKSESYKIIQNQLVEFYQIPLEEDNYSIKPNSIIRLDNKELGESGVRIETVYYSKNYQHNIVCQTFLNDNKFEETTAYVCNGTSLIDEFFSDTNTLKTKQKFIRNKWNGNVFLSLRQFEKEVISFDF